MSSMCTARSGGRPSWVRQEHSPSFRRTERRPGWRSAVKCLGAVGESCSQRLKWRRARRIQGAGLARSGGLNRGLELVGWVLLRRSRVTKIPKSTLVATIHPAALSPIDGISWRAQHGEFQFVAIRSCYGLEPLPVMRASSPGPWPGSPEDRLPCSCDGGRGQSRIRPAARSSSSPYQKAAAK